MSAEVQYATAETPDTHTLALSEARVRADTYSLLAALLRAPPGPELLNRLSALEVADAADDFSRALVSLKLAARQVTAAEIDDEFHTLFVGLGRGELVPYASWYLTGFLMEQPLGELRRDLAMLGFDRQEGVCEPEDHIAAICEVLSMLILDGADDIDTHRGFFDKHFGCWVGRFFTDLGASDSAVFYRAVAGLGSAFTELEQRYLTQEV